MVGVLTAQALQADTTCRPTSMPPLSLSASARSSSYCKRRC